jgi:hypothetical protein
VPCYKEDLEVVENTVKAILNADFPHNTSRTVYVCDDGNDPMKRDFCKTVSDVVYLTGRYREKGGQAMQQVPVESRQQQSCMALGTWVYASCCIDPWPHRSPTSNLHLTHVLGIPFDPPLSPPVCPCPPRPQEKSTARVPT